MAFEGSRVWDPSRQADPRGINKHKHKINKPNINKHNINTNHINTYNINTYNINTNNIDKININTNHVNMVRGASKPVRFGFEFFIPSCHWCRQVRAGEPVACTVSKRCTRKCASRTRIYSVQYMQLAPQRGPGGTNDRKE